MKTCLLIAAFGAAAGMLCAGESMVRVADINPGPASSYPDQMTVHNDAMYFRANTGLNDTELWRFDGTNATRAADIVPGPGGSSPAYLTSFQGQLYFDATTPSGGVRLYRYDGATASIVPTVPTAFWPGGGWKPVEWGPQIWFRTVKSPVALACFNGTTLARLNSPPWPNSEPVLFNGCLYYAAQDNLGSSGYGVELWRFDGTTQTRVSDLNPNSGDSYPEAFFVQGNTLYFRANDGTHGYELYRYTGSGSPQLVADLNPGPGFANPGGFVTFRNTLYFSADDGVHGFELWRLDGSQPVLAADINPNPYQNEYEDPTSNSTPSGLTVLNERLYFAATDGTYYGLWSYDGTEARIVGGGMANSTTQLAVFRGELYFDADDGQSGRELWKMVADANPRIDLAVSSAGTKVTLTEAETALYTIQGSNDMVHWETLGTARPVDGRISLDDPPGPPQRFYRAVRP